MFDQIHYHYGGDGACCLVASPIGAPVTNAFSCPLPAGASDCKCYSDPGPKDRPGVTCKN